MRTLKLALAAVAGFAFNASAQTTTGPHGMGTPPTGFYQPAVVANSMDVNNIAFHAGGVAACDGCHVMHNAAGGAAKSTNNGAGEPAWSSHSNAYLLQGSDQSSTCLICHGDPNQKPGTPTDNQFVVADLSGGVPSQRSPGGDFGWTRLAPFPGAGANAALQSTGEMHGHNVAAKDFGWLTDQRFTTAPGGTFTVVGTTPNGLGNFACSSCHDPHGRFRLQVPNGGAGTVTNGIQIYSPTDAGLLPIATSGSYGAMPAANYATGVYRLLAGRNYEPASKTGFPFVSDPPVAVAPRTYNRNETASEVRVQYGTGMSEWCKNCHPDIHMENYQTGWSGQRHPAASNAYLHQSQYNVYNTYLSSANYQVTTGAYTSLVPFEQGNAAALTPAVLAGQAAAGANLIASDTTNVMCLSCHRAHASAFDSMIRWDQNATFLTDGAGVTDGLYVRPAGATLAGYYNRGYSATAAGVQNTNGTVLGPYQRSLCNKCHGKD